jgi:hypothetical protein
MELAAMELAAMELAARHGLVIERGPHHFRFAHALVRDALYEDISHTRRARWHRLVAETIERLRPDDVAALADHYLAAAGDRAEPRAAHFARAAAERAEQRFAPGAAARLWQAALDHAGDIDVRSRLDLLMGLVRALAVSGDLGRAREHRAEALTLAESLDDPMPVAKVIGAFDVPALWTDPDDPRLARRIAGAAERALAVLPPDRAADRSRLLATVALELRSAGGERARAAAREAEAIARQLGDPAVLAFALNARFMQSFYRAGRSAERARIGAELIGADMPMPFRILGHLILVQAHSARADFAAADRHAAAADELGVEHEVPLVAVFTRWYRAMRDSLTAALRVAEAGFRAAAAQLAGSGMSGLDGMLPLALHCLRVQRGRSSSAGPGTAADTPRDLLFEARACLRATAAIRDGDRAAAERLYRDLLPAADELAGAGSGLLTLGPVASYLGDLAAALGRPGEAAAHRDRARAVADRAVRTSTRCRPTQPLPGRVTSPG